MADSAYSDLLSFVLEGAKKCDLAALALQEAAPVLRQVLSGECCLKQAADLDRSAVRDGITLATGRPVRLIVTVSLAGLQRSDRCDIDQLCRKINGTSLCDRLIERHAASMWKGLSSIDRYRLFRRLTALDRPLTYSVEGASRTEVDIGLNSRVRSCLDEGLYLLLGQAMAGNRRQLKKLIPLCRLLPSYIPLGEDKDEPGTWYVLVA